MLSDPRSISYVLECVHNPVRHEAQSLKKFYAKTVEDERLGYANFNTGPMGAQMTTVHGPASFPNTTSHSALALGADRFQIKEEWPTIGIDDFVFRARAAVELCWNELPIAQIVALQCVVRTLVSVQGVEDCRTLINESFFDMDDADYATFGKGPALFGLRLAFPLADDGGVHGVRVESFNGDPRSLFLEDVGLWAQPLQQGDLQPVEVAIRGTYDYVSRAVVDWLKDRL